MLNKDFDRLPAKLKKKNIYPISFSNSQFKKFSSCHQFVTFRAVKFDSNNNFYAVLFLLTVYYYESFLISFFFNINLKRHVYFLEIYGKKDHGMLSKCTSI